MVPAEAREAGQRLLGMPQAGPQQVHMLVHGVGAMTFVHSARKDRLKLPPPEDPPRWWLFLTFVIAALVLAVLLTAAIGAL